MTDEARRVSKGRLSAEDLELFNRQLLTAARTGAPLVPALEALSRDLRRGRFRDAVEGLCDDLRAGKSLSEAIAAREGQFPPLYTAMAEAAAASGDLAGVAEMLSQLVTSVSATRRRVVAAVAYPLILLVAATGLMLFLLAGPVTEFATLREHLPWGGIMDLGREGKPVRPWSLDFLLAARHAGFVLVGAVWAVLLTVGLLAVTRRGRELLGRLFSVLALFGPILRAQREFLFCPLISHVLITP